MDFAEREGASLILRGLRAVADFEYEYQMAGMNQQLNDRIETVFLMADVQPPADRVKAGERNRPLWRRDRQVRHAGGRRRRGAAPEARLGAIGNADGRSMMSKAWLASPLMALALVAAKPAPVAAPAPLPLVAPAAVAADPANRWTIELSTGAKVVVQLRPDLAPQPRLSHPAADHAGLLQRPRCSTA